MQIAVYIAVALAVVIAPACRLAARRLAPRPASLTLAAVSVFAAAGWVWSLSLLTATLVNSAPASADRLLDLHMSQDPVPAWVGLCAALLLGAGGGRLLQVVAEEIRRVRATHRLVMACTPAGGELLVIADPIPQAFALPSLLQHPGRIVVSTAMLRALDAEERAALLAHERSHLRNRHSWLRSTVGLAAAVHPLMGRIGDQLAVALERWADEDAADMVANRRVAARSLGRAALATLERSPSQQPAPHGRRPADPFLRARIAALQGEAPRSRWRPAMVVVALLALMTATAAAAAHDLEALFDPGVQTSSRA